MSTISVSVITRRKNPLHLHLLEGRTLSHEEFNETYAAHPSDFTALRAYALEHGLTVDEAASSLARRTIVLRGEEVAVKTAIANAPQEHADKIETVLGFDQRPIAKTHFRALKRVATRSYSPVEVARLYGFPQGDGKGQTIGILELGGGYVESDLTEFFGELKMPVPTVVAVSVDGATNAPGVDADGEVALDIQVAGAIAPGARLAVYFAPNTTQGFVDAITTAVHDPVNKPSVLSISWGGPEASWTAAALQALDEACKSAGALGVTITVASGDDGSSDGARGDNVDFPASSPHVLACGGTELTGTGTAIAGEVTWNDETYGGGASGGGISRAFVQPGWQAKPKLHGRGLPDVAGNAAPETGYNIVVHGQKQAVGGTSAVAPLFAALIAILNQQRGQPVGFVNPTFYANPKAFRDIVDGSNGTFYAGKGWDACTGLGSPNGAAIAKLFKQPAPLVEKMEAVGEELLGAVKRIAGLTAPSFPSDEHTPPEPAGSAAAQS